MQAPLPPSYCAALVRRCDYDRFLTALCAPAPARQHLFALYAFNVEVARIRELARDPLLGEIRLQWWRETIASAYSEGAPPAHPVAQALSATIRACHLRRAPVEALIDARARDLDDAPHARLEDLESYADATSAGLMRLALGVLGDILGGALPDAVIRHAGIGWALTGIIRSIGFHAVGLRVYLPLDLLHAEGLTPEVVLAGRMNPQLRRVIDALANCAAGHFAMARAVRPPRKAMPALLPAVLGEAYIKAIRSAGFDPFQSPAPIPGYRRQIRLARAMLLRRL